MAKGMSERLEGFIDCEGSKSITWDDAPSIIEGETLRNCSGASDAPQALLPTLSPSGIAPGYRGSTLVSEGKRGRLGENVPIAATRGLLVTDHAILNHGQVTWTTPEMAFPSPSHHTTPTGGRLSCRQI
ncbi:hypothetical protein TNCV_4270201 [Trichonephila clavipes]|nr:hypothetical protein TNCV_4270201 [Trichonephila clavipes]